MAKTPLTPEDRTLVTETMTGSEGSVAEISINERGRTIYLRPETFGVTDSRGISIGRGLYFHDITADSELDRMKTSLISTVSHELRTPLAAIKGYATTLLADDVVWDQATQREFISIISDETDRLSNLVNNLLDLSRIEAGRLQVSMVECRIEELVDKASRHVRLTSADHLELRLEPDLPGFFADPGRIETILRNLFENSVKYGEKPVLVHVGVRCEQDHFVFRVQDNGPGIPVEESERIFERFYRVDDSLARVTSGAGLGLAICRGLVRAHGGEIWVEQIEQGTCIAFSIPVMKGDADGQKQAF
jgi:signal transduction histidine kinase